MRPDDKRKITSCLNSLNSTGPKTPEGKQRSADNSRRHGAYARNLILPGEKLADFRQLLDTHLLLWAPTSLIEESLVCEMATTLWRIRRQAPAETSLIAGRPRCGMRQVEADALDPVGSQPRRTDRVR